MRVIKSKLFHQFLRIFWAEWFLIYFQNYVYFSFCTPSKYKKCPNFSCLYIFFYSSAVFVVAAEKSWLCGLLISLLLILFISKLVSKAGCRESKKLYDLYKNVFYNIYFLSNTQLRRNIVAYLSYLKKLYLLLVIIIQFLSTHVMFL